jgi:hypothetical protein
VASLDGMIRNVISGCQQRHLAIRVLPFGHSIRRKFAVVLSLILFPHPMWRLVLDMDREKMPGFRLPEDQRDVGSSCRDLCTSADARVHLSSVGETGQQTWIALGAKLETANCS